MSSHAQSGIGLNIDGQAAKIMYRAARASWANRRLRLGEILAPSDDFSGLRAIDASQLPPGTFLGMGMANLGPKAGLAERAGRYDTLAHDLLAAVCDDAVIGGGEPVLAGSVLDTSALEYSERLDAVRQLAVGYTAAAAAAGIGAINGEIGRLAMSPGAEEQFRLTWGASVLWFANEQRLITGTQVRPGDSIVGLAEPGLRVHGIPLLARALDAKYGPDWRGHGLDGTPILDLALIPSTIYSQAILGMFGGWSLEQPARARLHALAHITAGGLPGQLARALRPSGYGANIDNPLLPPRLMLHCQEIGGITDHEAYQSWHMGQGMVVITPEPHAVLAIARGHRLDAQVIGNVTEPGPIRIASQGHYAHAKPWLEF